MNVVKKSKIAQSHLSSEQIKLLDYLGDITDELSLMAYSGGFLRISEILKEAATEAKAIR